MKKTYGMPLNVEANIMFPLNGGKAHLRVRFTGGQPHDTIEMPAKYTTENEVEQMIIESSPMFGKTIFEYGPNGEKLESVPRQFVQRENPEPEAGPAPVASGKLSVRGQSFPEVTNNATMSEKLLELGVPASELKTRATMLMAAKRLGISFPNLK